jgi:hypothetical protein
MNANYLCLRELETQGLFENNEHRKRFNELISCYSDYPFFNKGLCKCMYLSSWDMEHFLQMLDILNDMTLGKSRDVEVMKDNGIILVHAAEGYDRYIFQLSCAFLANEPFEMPAETLEKKGMYIIEHAFQAAAIIDRVFDGIESQKPAGD